MKKIILLFTALLLINSAGWSQVKIGDNSAAAKGAALDLNSTFQGGLLLPNVNITDLGSIPATFTDASVAGQGTVTALAGMIVWNTNTTTGVGVYMWDGDNWKRMVDWPKDGALVGGIIWATKNVNAPGTFTANIGDPGMFYQWDRKIGWSSADPMTSNPAGQTWSSTGSTNTAWDMTNNNPCPTGWRVPSAAELTSLNNAGSVWITGAQATTLGIGSNPGRIYGVTTLPASFSSSTMVFLPAAGTRGSSTGALTGVGTAGDYWGTGVSTGFLPANLSFSTGSTLLSYGDKVYGLSVRCVVN